jgi:hypothetical protein
MHQTALAVSQSAAGDAWPLDGPIESSGRCAHAYFVQPTPTRLKTLGLAGLQACARHAIVITCSTPS